MMKNFDDFSKKLAAGVSRRKAFWSLLTGAGALGLAAAPKALASPVAHAIDPSCPSICFQQSNLGFTACVEDFLENCPSMPFGAIIGVCLGCQTSLYQECLTESAYCPPGCCATIHYTLSAGNLEINCVTCGRPS